MTAPTIGFSNETLERLPHVRSGDTVDCPVCRRRHTLKPSRDQDGRASETLLVFVCGDEPYLGALNGRLVVPGSTKGR